MAISGMYLCCMVDSNVVIVIWDCVTVICDSVTVIFDRVYVTCDSIAVTVSLAAIYTHGVHVAWHYISLNACYGFAFVLDLPIVAFMQSISYNVAYNVLVSTFVRSDDVLLFLPAVKRI